MNHGQFQMRVRVVHRHARVLGERDHGEGHTGEQEARVDRQFAVRQCLDDRGQRGRARNHRRAEQDHQQRRLGQKTDQHLAPRTERAKRGAHVHGGQRDEDARQREQADQRDRVGRRRQRQIGRERRHDGAGQQHAAEHDVGRHAKQRGRVLGQHRLLDEQLVQHAVRLQQARRRLVLQPGAPLVDPAGHQRREQQGHSNGHQLRNQAQKAHCLTTSSTTISVTKLYIR